MTRAEAIERAIDASERHDKLEARLLQLEIYTLTTGLTEAEREERILLWGAHDVVERETISAYAHLYVIDPAACERLRNGEAP